MNRFIQWSPRSERAHSQSGNTSRLNRHKSISLRVEQPLFGPNVRSVNQLKIQLRVARCGREVHGPWGGRRVRSVAKQRYQPCGRAGSWHYAGYGHGMGPTGARRVGPLCARAVRTRTRATRRLPPCCTPRVAASLPCIGATRVTTRCGALPDQAPSQIAHDATQHPRITTQHRITPQTRCKSIPWCVPCHSHQPVGGITCIRRCSRACTWVIAITAATVARSLSAARRCRVAAAAVSFRRL